MRASTLQWGHLLDAANAPGACWRDPDPMALAESPYLIALALIEQNGGRAMPICGKSLSAAAAEAMDPGQDGPALALDLLLRIWQRSDGGAVRRASGDSSLLLQIAMDVMQEQLPGLKAEWLNGGSTETLLENLASRAQSAWRITIAKYESVNFVPWP